MIQHDVASVGAAQKLMLEGALVFVVIESSTVLFARSSPIHLDTVGQMTIGMQGTMKSPLVQPPLPKDLGELGIQPTVDPGQEIAEPSFHVTQLIGLNRQPVGEIAYPGHEIYPIEVKDVLYLLWSQEISHGPQASFLVQALDDHENTLTPYKATNLTASA